MSVGSHEGTGGYHDRIADSANGLAVLLQEQGLDATLQQAQLDAEGFQHDFKYLMSEAAGVLFRSGDPALQEHGLGYLAWEAEHFPDPQRADGIAYDAKYDARHDDHREFARRCFEVSLAHFRFAAQAEGFVPTASFIEPFTLATARMEEEGYPDLYADALTEFAPLAIAAAEGYALNPATQEDGTDYDKTTIDEALHRAAGVLRKTNPDLAQQARSLITSRTWLNIENASEADASLTDAFITGDYELAKTLLANTDQHLIQRLWNPMLERLQADSEAAEWGNKVLDTVVEARPDYFVGNATDDSIDFFYGRNVGQILGRLNRTDLVDSLVNPDLKETATGITATGIAHGLGTQVNHDGFAHLLTRIPRYSPESVAAVRSHFEAGLQESVPATTE